MSPIPPDMSPTPEELRAAVHDLVSQAARTAIADHGAIPGVRDPEWWTAPTSVRLAAILIMGEAYLIADPQRMAVWMLREMSNDLAGATNWAAVSRRPSHVELERRRAEPGTLAQLDSFDPVAAARWVVTGTSDDEVGAA